MNIYNILVMHYAFGFNIRLYTTAFIFSSSIFYWCAFLEDDITRYACYTYFQVFTHIIPQQITNVEVLSCIYSRTCHMELVSSLSKHGGGHCGGCMFPFLSLQDACG